MLANSRASALLLAAAVTAAAGCSTAPERSSGDVGGTAPVATAAPTVALSVSEARYGSLVVRTDAGARCGALLRIRAGTYGDAPPGTLADQTAGADGLVSWTYAAPRVPAGTASYTVSCQSSAASESRSGAFSIPTH
ncbi:MAG TPA: hypothetical protein VGQ86_11830, partial [Candidatus Limnocylindria bacterium]|nr:hypothetical protein [Candidatus Limnocylindria bacterium]